MKKHWAFDTGSSGFRFDDDAFRYTSEPLYAKGGFDGRSGGGGSLALRLGGRDDEVVRSMSGGWTKGFELDEAQHVTLRFRVKLKQGPDYKEKEYADVRVAVDGEAVDIAGKAYAHRLVGDGEGGGRQKIGWTTVEVDLGLLAAGRHDFTIGGFSNRKSSKDAYTKVLFDDVRLDGVTPPQPRLGAFEAEVLRLTNEFREKNGLDALRSNAHLNAAAEDWSREMAKGDFFKHSSKPNQLAHHGYDADGWAENIAAGYQTPELVVNGWINSPGHRANMLRADFKHLGVGYYYKSGDGGAAPYGHYWTQEFGAPDDDYLF